MANEAVSPDGRRPSLSLEVRLPHALQYAPSRRRPSLETCMARGPVKTSSPTRHSQERRPSLDGIQPPIHARRPSIDSVQSQRLGRRPSLDGRRPSLDGRRPSIDRLSAGKPFQDEANGSAFGIAGLAQMVDVYEGGRMRRRGSLASNASVGSNASAGSGTQRQAELSSQLAPGIFAARRPSITSRASSSDGRRHSGSPLYGSLTSSAHSRMTARRGSNSSTMSAESMASLMSKLGHASKAAKDATAGSSIPLRSRIIKYLRTGFARHVRRGLESSPSQIFFFILSVFALFGDDIRIAAFSKSADKVFNVITYVSLALFTAEILVSSCVVHDYVFSFFFLLDVIATISLVLDITYVWEALMGYESFTSSAESVSDMEGSALGQSEYARAGRSSRVGTRIARILRVIRLVRVVRIFKFNPFSNKDVATKIMPGEATGTEEGRESRVGQKLSERTTAWVIVLVITMLIMIPLLDPGDVDTMMAMSSAQYGADVIQQAWQDYLIAASGNSVSVAELRLQWERQVLLYVYYHNFYASCPSGLEESITCVSDTLFKLCYLGFVLSDGIAAPAVQKMRLQPKAWTGLFPGSNNDRKLRLFTDELPDFLQRRFTSRWTTGCGESETKVYGVSLLKEVQCPWKHLRMQEIVWYFPGTYRPEMGKERMVFFFDLTDATMWQAIMGMLQTVFIIVVLTVGALFFSKDADKLVLAPIEGMISKVAIIRKDPLYAIRLGEEKYQQQIRKKEAKESGFLRNSLRLLSIRSSLNYGSALSSSTAEDRRRNRLRAAAVVLKKKVGTLETKILENTIIQLGSLLALGFGQAGTEIIGKNLDDDVNSTVNVMIPGRTVEAIYGYCQIKNFAVTTEVLQQKTMVFVNQVADIVHRTIDEHLGSANKNVGEAFLLVWRLDAFKASTQRIADLSVLSFVQVIVAVNRDQDLANYREHPALLARLGSYRVRLGFGLHIGWAIEGAIGSEFKIDASYLSTHVNLAMKLEAVSGFYGVPVLMTEPLVRSCSERFLYQFRAIDHVKMEGQKNPLRLFTVDLDSDALFVDNTAKKRMDKNNRWMERRDREDRKQAKLEDSFEPMDFFNQDRHIRRMRAIYFLEFFQDFEKGFLNYEAGEWDVAARVFGQTATMLKNRSWHSDPIDGPSRALLDFMFKHKFQAPAGWRGFRELTDRDESRSHAHLDQDDVYVAHL